MPGNVTHSLRPLSERALARLPGPPLVWIVVWALIPWLNAGANLLLGNERTSAVWEQSDLVIVLNYVALSFASGFTLWATGDLVRSVERLRATAQNVVEGDGTAPFRGMNSVAGPLISSTATALVFGGAALARDGWPSAILRGSTWLLLGIALWSFLWTYGSLQLGLSRLGRQRLVPSAVHVDPGLGLQPLGRLASTGLWMLLVWLVPVALTGLPDVAGALIGLLVLIAALAAFFVSLLGLHRQMVEVKASELEIARGLYAEAYEPVHEARTLEALDRQRSLLGAADALEKRASAIHEWPFDDRTVTVVVAITTSVVAMTIGRLILDPIGL